MAISCGPNLGSRDWDGKSFVGRNYPLQIARSNVVSLQKFYYQISMKKSFTRVFLYKQNHKAHIIWAIYHID